jgi:hypothetical protein
MTMHFNGSFRRSGTSPNALKAASIAGQKFGPGVEPPTVEQFVISASVRHTALRCRSTAVRRTLTCCWKQGRQRPPASVQGADYFVWSDWWVPLANPISGISGSFYVVTEQFTGAQRISEHADPISLTLSSDLYKVPVPGQRHGSRWAGGVIFS